MISSIFINIIIKSINNRGQAMDIKDFENNFKYKLYLPFVYVANWVLMLTGPFYFPSLYQRYYLCAIAYLAVRSTMTFLWTLIGCLKANFLLQSYKQSQKIKDIELKEAGKAPLLSKQTKQVNTVLEKSSFFHAFIIPNFNEEQQLLTSTLQQLSKHKLASHNFLVFLAMEAHEKGSKQKAEKLVKKFKNNFKLISFTVHTIRQYQQKGKASNVSWCAQNIQQMFFKPNKINPDKVILTIIDADSWIPSQYIDQINKILMEKHPQRHKIIFEPCQMFTRNYMEVPAMSRTYDISHGMVHFSNLFTIFGTSFPLSNYSLSYILAKSIGFWDTCPDAIGEDFHTTIKAFFKTKGDVQTIPIFTPFNQANIQTGKGYFKDIASRFWQAERHGRGCADASYCLNKIHNEGINLRTFLISYQVLQITTLPGILPWCMISSTGMSIYYHLYGTPPDMVNQTVVGALFNICTVSFVLSFFLYNFISRKASRLYYGLKNNNVILASVEYLLYFIPNLFLITVPSATIAAFRIAFGQNVYQVAEKKITAKK